MLGDRYKNLNYLCCLNLAWKAVLLYAFEGERENRLDRLVFRISQKVDSTMLHKHRHRNVQYFASTIKQSFIPHGIAVKTSESAYTLTKAGKMLKPFACSMIEASAESALPISGVFGKCAGDVGHGPATVARILLFLNNKNSDSNEAEIAKGLGMSPETMRRQLMALNRIGAIRFFSQNIITYYKIKEFNANLKFRSEKIGNIVREALRRLKTGAELDAPQLASQSGARIDDIDRALRIVEESGFIKRKEVKVGEKSRVAITEKGKIFVNLVIEPLLAEKTGRAAESCKKISKSEKEFLEQCIRLDKRLKGHGMERQRIS